MKKAKKMWFVWGMVLMEARHNHLFINPSTCWLSEPQKHHYSLLATPEEATAANITRVLWWLSWLYYEALIPQYPPVSYLPPLCVGCSPCALWAAWHSLTWAANKPSQGGIFSWADSILHLQSWLCDDRGGTGEAVWGGWDLGWDSAHM